MFVDAPGGFHHRPVTDHVHTFLHGLRRHVVQHDHIGTAFHCLSGLLQAFHLDFDFRHVAGVGFGPCQGFLHAAGHGDVVVLDQDGVVEPQPVVVAATGADGVFFQQPQSRCGLPGVHHPGAVGSGQIRQFSGPGGDAGQVLEQIQGQPFPGEHAPGTAGDLGDEGPRFQRFSVPGQGFKSQAGVQHLEHPPGHLHPAEDPRILGVDDSAGHRLCRQQGLTGQIPAAHIFRQPFLQLLIQHSAVHGWCLLHFLRCCGASSSPWVPGNPAGNGHPGFLPAGAPPGQ